MPLRLGFLLGAAVLLTAVVTETAVAGRPPGFELRSRVFRVLLLPFEEVDPPVPPPARARGSAVIRVDRRGHKLDVEIQTTRLSDVVQAHFHLGARGTNGPVVVQLYGPADPAGRERGRLLCRTVTRGDLRGSLEGAPLSALVDEMLAGNIYINIHTVENPAGAIRGQVRASGIR